jgi:hypothetical protein
MAAEVEGKILLPAPPRPAPPASVLIAKVAKSFGISPLRQFSEMVQLRRRGIDFHEYYSNRLFRPELGMADKRTFVGRLSNLRLNERLSPPRITGISALVQDKILLEVVLRELGLSATTTQAVVAPRRFLGRIRTITAAPELEAFLRDEAVYPLFAKPIHGSRSVGSVMIEEVDRAAGTVLLGNGRRCALGQLVKEMLEDHRGGVAIQSMVAQHPALSGIVGRAVGTVRVVTVRDGQTPRLLYAAWKIPSPSAMSDNFWQDGSMLGAVDAETGAITRCIRGKGLDAEEIAEHPVSHQPLVGVRLPNWTETCQLATNAHAIFPELGILGWDVAISDRGPVIIECNGNPHHSIYQLASGRGLLNADFAPTLDRIARRQAENLKKVK